MNCDLEGFALDRAVSALDGCVPNVTMPYSTEWLWGGQVIENAKITLVYADNWTEGPGWHAFSSEFFEHVHSTPDGIGETALIAAMRAFVSMERV